ncbi:MAG: transglycosylase domain-containing protein [Candidatus Dormibacteraeota bacterium]|nr:transglycosylase domain-containing protein [Candidatus Dormibacteraeota bacterium]
MTLAVAGVGLFGASVATGPNVEALPATVTAIDAAHNARPVSVSPSDRVARAVVAVEDGSFYSHDGIDTLALLRAAAGFVTGSDSGGSTIEVQLAHLAFPGPTSGFWGRVHRVTLALQMDTRFTKPAILSMYLDAAYFGHGHYGIVAASRGYFGVTPSQLSWSQAALLAGLVQAPSSYDPIEHPAAATARRGYVLQRLVAVGALTQAAADALAHSPLGAA